MIISEREGPPVLHHVRLKSGISPRHEGMNKPRIGEYKGQLHSVYMNRWGAPRIAPETTCCTSMRG